MTMSCIGLVFINQKYLKLKPMASGRKGFAKNEKLKTLLKKYKSLSFGCRKMKTCKYKTTKTTITTITTATKNSYDICTHFIYQFLSNSGSI